MKFKQKKLLKQIGIGTAIAAPLFGSLSFAFARDLKTAETITQARALLREGQQLDIPKFSSSHHREQYLRGETPVQYAQESKADGSSMLENLWTPAERDFLTTNPFSYFLKEKYSTESIKGPGDSNRPFLKNKNIHIQHSPIQFSPFNYGDAFVVGHLISDKLTNMNNKDLQNKDINIFNFVNNQFSVPWNSLSYFPKKLDDAGWLNLLPASTFNDIALFYRFLNNHNYSDKAGSGFSADKKVINESDLFLYEFLDLNKNEYYTYKYTEAKDLFSQSPENFIPGVEEFGPNTQTKQDISEVAQFWTNAALLYLMGWGQTQTTILNGIANGSNQEKSTIYSNFAHLFFEPPPPPKPEQGAQYSSNSFSMENFKTFSEKNGFLVDIKNKNKEKQAFFWYPFLDFRFNRYNPKEDSFDITNIANHLFAVNYDTDNFESSTSAYNDGNAINNDDVKERTFGISVNPLILYSIANMHNALQFYYECLSTPLVYFVYQDGSTPTEKKSYSAKLMSITKNYNDTSKENYFELKFEIIASQESNPALLSTADAVPGTPQNDSKVNNFKYSPFSFLFTKSPDKNNPATNNIKISTNGTLVPGTSYSSIPLSYESLISFFPVKNEILQSVPVNQTIEFPGGFALSDLFFNKATNRIPTSNEPLALLGAEKFIKENWINNNSKLDVTELNTILDDPRWFDNQVLFKSLFLLKALILTGALTNFHEVAKIANQIKFFAEKDMDFLFPDVKEKKTFYSPWKNNGDFGLSKTGNFDFETADSNSSSIALSLTPALWWKIANKYKIPMDAFNKILAINPNQIISFNANILKPGLFGQSDNNAFDFVNTKAPGANAFTNSFSNTINVQIPMIQLWYALLNLSDANTFKTADPNDKSIVPDQVKEFPPLSLLLPNKIDFQTYSYAQTYVWWWNDPTSVNPITNHLIKMYWKEDLLNSDNPWATRETNYQIGIKFNLRNEIYTPLMHMGIAEVGAGLSIQPYNYFSADGAFKSQATLTNQPNFPTTEMIIRNRLFDPKTKTGGTSFIPTSLSFKDVVPHLFNPAKSDLVPVPNPDFSQLIINDTTPFKSNYHYDPNYDPSQPNHGGRPYGAFQSISNASGFWFGVSNLGSLGFLSLCGERSAINANGKTDPSPWYGLAKLTALQLIEGFNASKDINITYDTSPNAHSTAYGNDYSIEGRVSVTQAFPNLSLSQFPSSENNLYSRLMSNLQLETFSYTKNSLLKVVTPENKIEYSGGYEAKWPLTESKTHPLDYFFSKGLFSKEAGVSWTYWLSSKNYLDDQQKKVIKIPDKTQSILLKPESTEDHQKKYNTHLPLEREQKVYLWLNTDFNFTDQTSPRYRPNFLSTIYTDVTTNVKTLVNILESTLDPSTPEGKKTYEEYYIPLLQMMNKLPSELFDDAEFRKTYLTNRYNPNSATSNQTTPSDGLGLFYQFNKNFIDNNMSPDGSKVSQYGLIDLGMKDKKSLDFTPVYSLLDTNNFPIGDDNEKAANLLSDLLGSISLNLNWKSISNVLDDRQTNPIAISKQIINLFNFAKRLNLKFGSQTISARDFPYSTDIDSDYQLFSATKPSDLTINNIVNSSILTANQDPYKIKNEYGLITNLSPAFLKQMLLYSPSKNYGDTSLPANYYDIISEDPSKAFNPRLDPKKEPRRPGLAIAMKHSDLTHSLHIKLIVRNPDISKIPSPLVSFLNENGSGDSKLQWDKITATPIGGPSNSQEEQDQFKTLTLTITDVGWSRTGDDAGASSGNDEELNNRPVFITSLEDLMNQKLYLTPLKNPKYNELLDYIKNFKVSGDKYEASAEKQKPSAGQLALLSQLFTFKNKKGQKFIISEEVWKQAIDVVNTANSRIIKIEKENKPTEEKLTSFSVILDLSVPLFLSQFNPSLKLQQDIITKSSNVVMQIQIPDVNYNTEGELATTWQVSDILFVVFASLSTVVASGVGIWFLLRYLKRKNAQK